MSTGNVFASKLLGSVIVVSKILGAFVLITSCGIYNVVSAVNPFENGCLKVMAERYNDSTHQFEPRVCNSDDTGKEKTVCRSPKLENYFEVRTVPCDWDESIMLGWVNQILISEVLGVPSSIEGGNGLGDPSFSFYDTESRLKYPALNYKAAMQTLVEADRVDGDCSKTDKPCGHIMPSVWTGGKVDAKPFQDAGYIIKGSNEWNGIHGRIGLYIPIKTARYDPTLDTYLGLQGEKNRKKLAETFKTPTTWKDYCSLPYATCASGDDVASRRPTTEEEDIYFLEGSYTGHFRVDNTTNCTLNENCTGNIIAPVCSWTNFVESQMYWNNISLTSQGPVSPNNGYTYSQMLQIYSAANATKSDVMLWWWSPEILLSTYMFTDYALVRVTLPQPTRECTDYRSQGNIDRCNDSFEVRRGEEGTGACDYEPEIPTKLFSMGFQRATEADPDLIRNPAFELMQNFMLPLFPISTMFQLWDELRKSKEYQDPEREGVCRWVYENIDFLMEFVPDGYSRQIVLSNYEGLMGAGTIIGSITLLLVIVSFVLLYRWRREREIKYAQVDTLFMTTVGYFFIALAGILSALEPSNFSCTLTQWGLRLGYTLSMIPILIKLSAINKLNRAGQQFRRVDIDTKRFWKIMAIAITLLIGYLVLWTIVDRSEVEKEYYSKDVNGIKMVIFHNGCSSRSGLWQVMAYAFEALLLLATTILTYQSSDVIEELNESRTLAFMVYSHFLFLMMRLLVFIFMLLKMIPNALFLKLLSLIVSIDTSCAIIIYFGPKFLRVLYPQPNNARGIHMRSSSMIGSTRFRNISGVRIPEDGIPNLIVKRDATNTTDSKDAKDTKVSDFNGKRVSFGNSQGIFNSTSYDIINEGNKINESEQHAIESLNDDISSLLNNENLDELTLSKLRKIENFLERLQKNNDKVETDKEDKEMTPLIERKEAENVNLGALEDESALEPDY